MVIMRESGLVVTETKETKGLQELVPIALIAN